MLESKFLQDNVQNIQKLMVIPSLQKFETENLRKLLKLSKIREYAPGEYIIKEGEQDRWLYFLLSGKVRVEKEEIQIAIIDKMGEVFGEMRLIDRLSRSASVFAEEKTVCLAVDTSATDRLTSKDERANFLLLLYRMFVEFISLRLRLTNEQLIQCKKEVQRFTKSK
ncbi:MAG: cyclic nucleotide-binding domain-containing protein [Deltaproteobacteria bacterium]|nr:cyclic nucleotide-binding domain-containing protein [Deltaproteobacteria bacterium]